MTELLELPVELRGAPLALLDEITGYQGEPTVREYLIEGPAGTGKSRGVGEVLLWIAMTYPGTRGLVLRWTRKSLTDSFLKTWEEDVLPPGDPILAGAVRNNRHGYTIRVPGTDVTSEIVLGGLDEPGNLLSTDFDWIYVQQTEQIDLGTWMKLRTRLRNFGHPEFKLLLLLADVNPVEPTNWLNVRASRGHMKRLVSRHEDNPKLFNYADGVYTQTPEGKAYIASLDAMPEGPDKDRLRYGIWSARAGLVWRTYDAKVHQIDAPMRKPAWYVGSMDWGMQNPGVLQVWGVDGDDNAYRVREFYHTQKSLDWWAYRVIECYDEFQPLRCIQADPSRPDAIEHMNRRLAEARKTTRPYVYPANNARTRTAQGDLSGLDLVRVKLAERKLFFVNNALRDRDESLAEAGLPWCAEMEFPQFTYELDDEGKPVGELTDKTCADHAMDTTRYTQTYIWQRDLSDPAPPLKPVVGTRASFIARQDPEAAAEWLAVHDFALNRKGTNGSN